ncbi:MAG: hypothetical protein GKR90_26775 [Pseudomonadales bacterium]|nr:hypothetical protein [Pseudomonadales bacterium]
MIEQTWRDEVIEYKCSGNVYIQDLVESLQNTVEDARYSSTSGSMWDLRGAKYTFSMEEHNQTAPVFIAILGNPIIVRKTAWIVEFKLSEAIIDLYYENHAWPQDWKCFHSTNDARAWLSTS